MACILYKDGETLRCNPEDMDREIAAGWSTKAPNREEVKDEETTSEVTKETASKDATKKPQKSARRYKG